MSNFISDPIGSFSLPTHSMMNPFGDAGWGETASGSALLSMASSGNFHGAGAGGRHLRSASIVSSGDLSVSSGSQLGSDGKPVNSKKGKKKDGGKKKKKKGGGRWGSVMSRWAVLGPSKSSNLDVEKGKAFNKSEQGDLEYAFLFENTKKDLQPAAIAAAAAAAKSSRQAMARSARKSARRKRSTSPAGAVLLPGSLVPVPPPGSASGASQRFGTAGGGGRATSPRKGGVVSFALDGSGSNLGSRNLNDDDGGEGGGADGLSSSTSAAVRRGVRALRIASKTIAALSQHRDYNWGTRVGLFPHPNFELLFDAHDDVSPGLLRPTVSQWLVDVHRALDRPFFLWLSNWDKVDATFTRATGPLASASSSPTALLQDEEFTQSPTSPGKKKQPQQQDKQTQQQQHRLSTVSTFGESDLLHQAASAANGSSSSSDFTAERLPIQHPHRELDNLGTVFGPTVDNFLYPHRSTTVDPHSTEDFAMFRPSVRRFTGELQLGDQRPHLVCPTMQQVMQTTWLCAEIQRSEANQRLLDVIFCKHERTLGRIVARVFYTALEGDRSLLMGLQQFKRFARKAKIGSGVVEPWRTFGILSEEEEAAKAQAEHDELKAHRSGVFGASSADLSPQQSSSVSRNFKTASGSLASPKDPNSNSKRRQSLARGGGDAARQELEDHAAKSPLAGTFGTKNTAGGGLDGAENEDELVNAEKNNGVIALLPIMYSQLCKPYSGLSVASFALALFFLSEMLYRPAEQTKPEANSDDDDGGNGATTNNVAAVNDNDDDKASSRSTNSSNIFDFVRNAARRRQSQSNLMNNSGGAAGGGLPPPLATDETGVFQASSNNSSNKANKQQSSAPPPLSPEEILRYPDTTTDHEILCDTFITFVRNHLIPYLDTCLPWYADPDVSVATTIPRVHSIVDREYAGMLRQLFLLSSQSPIDAAYGTDTKYAGGAAAAAAAARAKRGTTNSASNHNNSQQPQHHSKSSVQLGTNVIDEEAIRPEDRRTADSSSSATGGTAAAGDTASATDLDRRVVTGVTLIRLFQTIAHTTLIAQRDKDIISAIEYMVWSVSLQHATNPGKTAMREYWAQGHSCSALVLWESAAVRSGLVDAGEINRRESNISLVEYFRAQNSGGGDTTRGLESRPVSVADFVEPLDSITVSFDGFVEAMCRVAILCELGRENSLRFPTVAAVEANVASFFRRKVSLVVRDIFGVNAEPRDDLRANPQYDKKDGLPVVHTVRLVARTNLLKEGPSIVHFHQVDLGGNALCACIHRALSVCVRPAATDRAGAFVVPPLKQVLRAIAHNGEHAHAPHTVKFRVSGRMISQASLAVKISYVHVFEISFGMFGQRWVAAPAHAVKENSELSPPFTFVTPTAMFLKEETATFTKLRELIAASPPGAAKQIVRFCRNLVCSARRCLTAMFEQAVGLVANEPIRTKYDDDDADDAANSPGGGGDSLGNTATASSNPPLMNASIRPPSVDEIGYDLGQLMLGWSMIEKRRVAGGAADERDFGLNLTTEASASFFGGHHQSRQQENSSNNNPAGSAIFRSDGSLDLAAMQRENTFSLLRRHSLDAESLSGPPRTKKLTTATEVLDMLVGGEAAKSFDWLLLMRKSRCCVPPMDDLDEEYLDNASSYKVESARSLEDLTAELMQDILMTDAAWVSRYEARTRQKMGLRAAAQQTEHHQKQEQQQRQRRGSISSRQQQQKELQEAEAERRKKLKVKQQFTHRTRFRHSSLFTAPTRLAIAFVAQVVRSACSAYRLQRLRPTVVSAAASSPASPSIASLASSLAGSIRAATNNALSAAAVPPSPRRATLIGGGVTAVVPSPPPKTAGAASARRGSIVARTTTTGGDQQPAQQQQLKFATAATQEAAEIAQVVQAAMDRENDTLGVRVKRSYFDRSLILGMLRTAVSTQHAGWSFLLVSRQRILGAVGCGPNGTALAGGNPPARAVGVPREDAPQSKHADFGSSSDPVLWTRAFVENGDSELRLVLDAAARRVTDRSADRTALLLADFVKRSATLSSTDVQLVGSATFHPLVPFPGRVSSLLREPYAELESVDAADTTRHPVSCTVYRIYLQQDKHGGSGGGNRTAAFSPTLLFGTLVETNISATKPFSGCFSTLSWQTPLFCASNYAMTLYSVVPLSEVAGWYREYVLDVRTDERSSSGAAVSATSNETSFGPFTVADAYTPGVVACAMHLFREHARDKDAANLRDALAKRGFIVLPEVVC